MARTKNDGRKNNARPEKTYKYNGTTETAIVKVLREHGLTGGYNWIRKNKLVGVRRCGELEGQEERVELSLPALQQLAKRHRVKFARGPRKAA